MAGNQERLLVTAECKRIEETGSGQAMRAASPWKKKNII
jgi:hypothetical protein